jgi:hypothetical protein
MIVKNVKMNKIIFVETYICENTSCDYYKNAIVITKRT